MLAHDFQFSQASLQDYTDCPRRFQLRYLRKLSWPAIEVEPIEEQEKRIQLGTDFHRIVQQHLMGIPTDVVEQFLNDENLERWWQNYKVYRPYDIPGKKYTELTLTLPVDEHRLVAKYDLLVIETDQRITVLDWKTTQVLPRTLQLQNRVQTRVYRFVLARAGRHYFLDQPLTPDAIEMIYWFPEFPSSMIRLQYSDRQFKSDSRYVTNLIKEIANLDEDSFRMTTDTKRCQYCRFRSYCGSTDQIGTLENYVDDITNDDSPGIDVFNFEQIAEIEF